MTLNRSRRILLALVLAAAMLVPAAIVSAATGTRTGTGTGTGTGPATPPPIAITGPRLKPPAIPHTDLVNVGAALSAPLPPQALEANLVDGGRTQEAPGRGIRQTSTGVGLGTTLYSTPNICNNFNTADNWAATGVKSDIWSDWYMGWAPFAINDGLYQAKNVVFTRERVVGPGDDYDVNQHSAKIASGQPYAAGFGSPIIPVPAGFEGGQVMVTVNYLIWDHDQGGKAGGTDGLDYDWASMGVKAGAASDHAHYVNGYVRGEWSVMSHTIDLGYAHDVMVLLQGHSPIVANSNIYFDNVKIAFMKGDKVHYLSDCTLEGTVR